MIAVKIGTTSWRQATSLAVDEVEFTGQWLVDTDGRTPLMVWDAGLGNVRAMTAGELAALPAQRLAVARTQANGLLTIAIGNDLEVAALRALVLTILDEFNLHALKLNAILDAVDAATSLADLKTRIGLIPDYPARTKAQLLTAMQTKITAGDADS